MNEELLLTQYEKFREWCRKQEKRESYEWSKWDGTEAHGNEINDVHCALMDKQRERLGLPPSPECVGDRQVCEEHHVLPMPRCRTYRLINKAPGDAPWKCQLCGNTANWLMLLLKS